MRKSLGIVLIVLMMLLTGCQSSAKSTAFEFGEDLVFIEKDGNYTIDLENSSDVVKEKYEQLSKTLDKKEVLDDIVAVTTTTANILSEIGINLTGAPESSGLSKDVSSKQYSLEETNKIDKSMVLNVGSALSPNIEAIVELNPMLVLYSDAMPKTDFIKNIEAADIKADSLGQSDYIDMFILLQRINELTEFKNDVAVSKMNEMVSELKETSEMVSKAESSGKTVAILQVLEGTIRVNNSDTVLGGITAALDLENVFASSENGELNKEQLLSLNPDYIIYYSHGMGASAISIFEEELNASDSVYRELDALKNKNVFQVAEDDLVFSASVDLNIIKIIKMLAMKFYE
ncbi:MAG: ABC transporter substrate-binding protein [Anaerorhabdus sp.]